MQDLSIQIEINGTWHNAGSIIGRSSGDAMFCYSPEYIEYVGKPISLSMPIQTEPFSPVQTRIFFDGLLPEGFSRKAVASWVHADTEDYLTILTCLGMECLGAIRIISDTDIESSSSYKPLSLEDVKQLASEGASKSTRYLMESHLSLAGASGKVGLYYDNEQDKWYQPIGDAPSTHILKQSHVRYKHMVTNELICLKTAENLGISTGKCFLVNSGSGLDEDILFASERYDRSCFSEHHIGGLSIPYRLHQEDFSQALSIPAESKYEKENTHYLQKMFDCIRRYSARPIDDQLELWDRIILNYLIGNTDGHIKNYSLLYSRDLDGVRLAPAYDVLSTEIYGNFKDMSMSIGRNYAIDAITRDSFSDEAALIGLGKKMALTRFDHLREGFKDALDNATDMVYGMGLDNADEIRDKIYSCFLKKHP